MEETGETAVVLGARGRFGRAAVAGFLAQGWRVKAVARRWSGPCVAGAEPILADAADPAALSAACAGAAVIVNALNPPYPAWSRELPRLTASVLAAARDSGATVMIPGNVYNFGPASKGEPMPTVLHEDLPQTPLTRKGRLRVEMERAYAEAADRGEARSVVLRAGDFIERAKSGNWFDTQMTPKLGRGRFTYPGRRDVAHAWAYLPDLGRAMAALATRRRTLPAFAAFGYRGYTLSGAALAGHLEEIIGRRLRISHTPWGAIRALSPISPLFREVLEMRYLWDQAHEIDGAAFAAALPEFKETPIRAALTDAVADHLPRDVSSKGVTGKGVSGRRNPRNSAPA
ncbi:MAG: NAD(P)H-binding protein [Pseudomonadota bacterium]